MSQTLLVNQAPNTMEAVHNFVTTLALAMLAEFAPLKSMVHALLFLILVDLITGLWASWVRGHKITSRRLSRTLVKTAVYILTIMIVWVSNKYIISTESVALSLDTIICSFIAITELKSVFENLQRISKQPILQLIIDRLTAESKWKEHELHSEHATDVSQDKPDEPEVTRGSTKRQK